MSNKMKRTRTESIKLAGLLVSGIEQYRNKQFDKAIPIFKKAVKITRKGDDPSFHAVFLNYLGISYFGNGEYGNALKTFQNVLLDEDKLSLEMSAAVSRNVGNTYKLLKDLKHANQYLQKALEIYHQIGDKTDHEKIIVEELKMTGGLEDKV